MTRREWLRYSAVLGLVPGSSQSHGGGTESADAFAGCQLYFGDLHNHSSVGYAKGSMERAFELARNHLDFFAFTPHGWWPDIGHYYCNIEGKWLGGFEVTKRRWPDVLKMVEEYDQPGQFVAIAGFEWHNKALGDYHIIFPGRDAEYVRINDLRKLQQFAKSKNALMIPHHPANLLGHRGIHLKYLDTSVSPVIEMFSEWGNAEHDRAPMPYIRHSEGGRWTRNTLQYILSKGFKLGVVASTDDHLAYPGAYREGLAAVWAKELSRRGVFEALRARRTYAVSGDRIALRFAINGSPMGTELADAKTRRISVQVVGWDVVERVEVLKNNRVIYRDFPVDREPTGSSWREPVLVRFEYGWGPWPALGLIRSCDWDIHIKLDGATIVDWQPCFSSGPYDESRRDKLIVHSNRHIQVKSYTALKDRLSDYSQKAIVLRVRATPKARVTVELKQPSDVSLTRTFQQLTVSNEPIFTGPFPFESALLHRIVFADNYRSAFELDDDAKGRGEDWYYVRVAQANEQYAWSSPIWAKTM